MAYVVTSPFTLQILKRAAQAAYQGQNSIALQLLTSNGLSYDDLRSYQIAQGRSTLGYMGTPATTPSLIPSPTPSPTGVVDTSAEPIAQQLSQVRMDWPSGTLYVGSNHYSILTTLIGGLVIKGIMWGGGKLASKTAPTPLVAAEQGSTSRSKARANPRRAHRNPFLAMLLPKLATGGTYAVGEYGVNKVIKGSKRSKRRRS